MARNHDEETPLGFVPKQTYEASEVSQTPERFRVVPRPPFLPGPVRFFRISSKTEEYAHVLDNLCSLREQSKPFDFEAHKPAACGLYFWAFQLSTKPILPKAHRTPEPSDFGLPHERIEQRHC